MTKIFKIQSEDDVYEVGQKMHFDIPNDDGSCTASIDVEIVSFDVEKEHLDVESSDTEFVAQYKEPLMWYHQKNFNSKEWRKIHPEMYQRLLNFELTMDDYYLLCQKYNFRGRNGYDQPNGLHSVSI